MQAINRFIETLKPHVIFNAIFIIPAGIAYPPPLHALCTCMSRFYLTTLSSTTGTNFILLPCNFSREKYRKLNLPIYYVCTGGGDVKTPYTSIVVLKKKKMQAGWGPILSIHWFVIVLKWRTSNLIGILYWVHCNDALPCDGSGKMYHWYNGTS